MHLDEEKPEGVENEVPTDGVWSSSFQGVVEASRAQYWAQLMGLGSFVTPRESPVVGGIGRAGFSRYSSFFWGKRSVEGPLEAPRST